MPHRLDLITTIAAALAMAALLGFLGNEHGVAVYLAERELAKIMTEYVVANMRVHTETAA